MSETKNIKELSVEEKLRALYDLQLIDSRLDEIRNTRGELPLEVEDLSDDVAQLETRIQKIVDDTKGLDEEIKLKKEAIKKGRRIGIQIFVNICQLLAPATWAASINV